MKRINNIYNKIISYENLELASIKAVKNDSKKDEIKHFEDNKERLLKELHLQLKSKEYTTSEYKIYTINDRGKERKIYDLPFYPDRIVHWALMLQLEEMFLKTFIYDTYAAIPKKGGHLALKRIKKKLNKGYKYCLKLDIEKYFPNIKQNILKRLLRRKVKCKNTLYLLDDIIESIENGIPIGNYTSQYFGNFYLSYFDHFCKEELKLKCYYRYMDDIVILSNNKNVLHKALNKMHIYLKNKLELKIKSNHTILNIEKEGIDFVGYRIYPKYVILRKSILKNMKSKLNGIFKHAYKFKSITYNMNCTIQSYFGWLKHCNSYNLYKKYINKIYLLTGG